MFTARLPVRYCRSASRRKQLSLIGFDVGREGIMLERLIRAISLEGFSIKCSLQSALAANSIHIDWLALASQQNIVICRAINQAICSIKTR